MKNALKHAGRALCVVLPTGLLAQLGMPALAALVFLAVLVLGVTCWIIGNGDRSDRVTRMIFARQGDARCLVPDPSAASLPASQPPHRRTQPAQRRTSPLSR